MPRMAGLWELGVCIYFALAVRKFRGDVVVRREVSRGLVNFGSGRQHLPEEFPFTVTLSSVTRYRSFSRCWA